MSAVRKAVLLAAGRGARLGELTRDFPKPLLDVGGRPILHRIIGGLAAAGIDELALVTGHGGALLEAATGNGETWGMAIHYYRQENLDGTAKALALARDFLGKERFFAGWGDIVVDAGIYQRVLEASTHAEAVLAVNEVDDPASGGAVYVDSAWRVTKLVEKPLPGTSSTRWNNAGLMVLPAEIWPLIDGLERSARGEYELPQAVAALIASGCETRAVPIEGPWFDIGTPESLAAARTYFGG